MAAKDIAIITLAFVAGLSFLGITSNAQGIGNLNYGAVCNITIPPVDDTELCNRAKHLICGTSKPTTCRCEEHMIYDQNLEKCIVLGGNACKERVNDGSFPTTCVNNSVCVQPEMNTEGTCECLMGFILTQSSECKLGFNGTGCTTHTDCNNYGFLQCGPDNRCVCDQEFSEWNAEKNQCQGLVGATCNADNRPCSENTNTECKNGKCTCVENFEEDISSHKCYQGYEGNCTATGNQCHPEFECNEDKCKCRTDEIYSESTRTCVLLAGLPCDPEENKCVENSACKDTSGTFTCQCVDGYSKDEASYCRAGHGTNCTISGDEQTCNTDIYLTCDSATKACVCEPNYTYQNERCEGKFGAKCKTEVNCKTSFCNRNANDTEGTCSCPTGSSVDKNQEKCYLKYGETCGSQNNLDCNYENLLGCNMESLKCDCVDPTIFLYQPTVDSDKCRAKADTQCEPENSILCVGNSTCVTDNSQGTGTGICRCSAGFKTGSDGQCTSTSGAERSLQASVAFAFLMTIFALFSSKN